MLGDKREPEQEPSTAAPRTVVVDASAERRAEVAALAAGLGARVPALATAEQALERAARDEIDCALLAVDQILVERPAFVDLVRALRRRQIPVLCYADGATQWPLGLRCRLLMAGAHLLFDSARGRALAGSLRPSSPPTSHASAIARRINGGSRRRCSSWASLAAASRCWG